MAQFVSAPLRPQTPLTFRDYTYYTPEIDPLNQEPTPQEYLPDSLAYFHLDHLGTPIEMTDRAGKTVWEATYQAWGEVEMVSGSLKQPFRFQGQYFDEESGLHYNRFRYYDPNSGRFVSQDPIGLLGGFNLYEYAPNPISWIDIFGLNKRKQGSAYDGSPKRTCPHSSIVNALNLFQGKRYTFGSNTFILDRAALTHILQRHHPEFWNGSVKSTQTFLCPDMKINEIVNNISEILKQNRNELIKPNATIGMHQFRGNGYTVGLKNGRIGQFY